MDLNNHVVYTFYLYSVWSVFWLYFERPKESSVTFSDSKKCKTDLKVWRLNVMRWLFGICMVCLSACECMLTLFYTFMSFLSVCMTFQTGLSKVKRLNAIQTGNISKSNDVWMLLPDFIVSWELQCNVSLHCITSCTLEHLFALQFNVFISLLWLLFIAY